MTGIVRFVTEPSTLQLVGSASAAAATITVPTHRAGDLIVISAYRNGSTTAPTLPGSWTNIVSGGSDGNALRVGRLIATGSGTSSGTWTNATHLTVEVWRGVNPTTPVGASAQAGGSGDTLSVPALTLQKTDGTSAVVGAYGHTASTSFTTPTGMIQRATVGTGPRTAISDTNGGVFECPTRNVTASTTGGWRTAAVEIRAKDVTVLDVNLPTVGMYVRDDESFSLGAPEWQAEPDTVNGDDGYRQVTFTVAVDLDYETAAENMSDLSRVLHGSSGWLMIQRGVGFRPMFFQWHRTAPNPMDWVLHSIDTYTLEVALTCDPYVYGERHWLDPIVITNNPGSGAGNRAFFQFFAGTFKGDAPAPLKVDIVPSGDWHGYQPFMSTAALAPGQTQAAPILWDLTAANFAAGTDTGGDSADANCISGTEREVSFATVATMATRLSGTAPTTPTPGTYKVLLRCGLSTDTTTVAVRFGQGYNVNQVRHGDTKTVVRPNTTITAYYCWVDLGEFTFPFGAPGLDAGDIGGVTAPAVEIQAQRVSGAANLRLDALLLIPLDTAATTDAVTQTSRFHGFGLEVNRSGVWDGQKKRFLSYDFGVNLANLRPPEIRGGWLRVTPGVVNVYHLLQQTQTATPAFADLDDDDEIANTATVTFSYLPRYLHMRPDTE